VRTLAEVFRLDWVKGGRLTWAAAEPYVAGVITAAGMCWAAVVTLYFFRRFRIALAVSIASIPVLIAWKLHALGP
jgi:dienelactone hydrolase